MDELAKFDPTLSGDPFLGFAACHNDCMHMTGNSVNGFSDVSKFVEQRIKELDVPSLAIGVQMQGSVIYEAAFGFADIEAQIPATTRTPYSVASITKPLISTILAKLAEDNKVDFGAPVNQYLGSAGLRAWVGNSMDATVGRLANHTSGLPLHFQFFFADEGIRPPSYIETVARHGNVVRIPGERYVYSNIGYGILGFAIEQITGNPLAEVLKDELFAPLEMADSFFAPPFGNVPAFAIRYDREGQALPHYITDHPAASEAYCSVHDLLKFGASHLALRDSSVLRQASMLAMQRPQGASPLERGYGLGWGLGALSTGDPTFGHSGGMDGVSTRLMILPAMEAVIVVLCNSDSPITSEVVAKIYEVMGVQTTPVAVSEPNKEVPQAVIGRWSGTIKAHECDVPIALEILPDGIDAELDGKRVDTDAHFEDSDIRGGMIAQIKVSDALRTPHTLLLDLQFRGDQFTGSVAARSIVNARIGHAISYPALLMK